MKRLKPLLLLILLSLAVAASGKTVYYFESSQLPDERYTEGCSISLDSEHPDGIVLMPGNRRLRLKGVTSCVPSGPGAWRETYGTERKRRVRIPIYDCSTTEIDSRYSVVLFKDLKRGVYAVEVLTGRNRIRFVPRSGEAVPVGNVPPVFIEAVQFTNVDADGGIIDDYGEEIIGREVRNQSQKMIYRSLLEDTPLTLDIRLLTPEGRLMRDAESSSGPVRAARLRSSCWAS